MAPAATTTEGYELKEVEASRRQERQFERELLLDPDLRDDADDDDADDDDADDDDDNDDDDNDHGQKPLDDEDSPYPEVRAAVRNYDEDMACSTVRAWTIGLFLVVAGSAMNTLFSLRQPSIGVGPLIAQVVAWPLGHGWAAVMPTTTFDTLGVRWTLNPGPFNIKEHSIIVVMAAVAFGVAYATDIILAQLVFYKQDFGLLFQLLLVISTQSLGYGIAGMMRKFLVYPASMIWPGNLVVVTLMTAMHEVADHRNPAVFGGGMSRYRWFGLVTAFVFVYSFVPGFLAQCLSITAVATWIAPQNPIVNQLFGGVTGLSILPLTLDWAQISGYVGSPLIPPWHAIANTLIGVVVFFIFGAAVLHYGGAWYGEFLPISDSGTYDNTGAKYDTNRILTPDLTLDEEAYRSYSPLFLSTTFAMAYGLSFAAISSLIVYTFLHHRKQIWQQYMNSTKEKPDVHMKMMKKYPEAPAWWYYSLFVLMAVLGLVTVLAYPTNMTWWAFLLAIAISFGFSLPIGIIQAVTSNQIGLNVLTEFVYGFKTFGYITMSRALGFVSDLKFGHYMKIPPRTMFLAQVAATTVSCVVQVIVINAALGSIDGVCTPEQAERFTCPGGRVFFAASVIWGLVGPARMFSPGQIYSGLFVFFIIGAVTPVVFYLAAKRRPSSVARHLIAPLIFGGAATIPPATPLNYLSWGIVGYVFQHRIRSRHFAWWSRLNFLTSSGLDLGLALATLVVFFAFTVNNIDPPGWWGNSVVTGTMDYEGTAVRSKVAEGEKFGPSSW